MRPQWAQQYANGLNNWTIHTTSAQSTPRGQNLYHERLATLDPDHDDETANPGFRTQLLAARKHSSSIRKPGEIGLFNQPSRPRHLTACISSLINVNGTKAYVLIDTGSTTNSMTPE
ncbi:hypothetical protein C8R43DRAFT_1123004 [Mycena crocata]|nr:hypothetical protein C8R43DRAFT_1123004 [Mycena crocata]